MRYFGLLMGALLLTGCGSQNPQSDAAASNASGQSPAGATSAAVPASATPGSAGASATDAAVATASATASAGAYQYDAAAGKKLYFTTCSVCHQVTGLGEPPVFPPLKGNPVVLNPDATQQIMTVLHGKSGPLEVEDVKYNGSMPAFAKRLTDADIANIINYERSSWGNQAKHTTATEVAAVRSANP